MKMRDNQILWKHIQLERNGRRLFNTYCGLNSCCEECNKKVRFWCKIKERLVCHQEKIIKKLLDEREYAERRITCSDDDCLFPRERKDHG